MAIWSLTQERVEKLLKQIGDKETEVDTLMKLSPKDIWNVDLDAFIAEWETQLEDEGKRKKKIAEMTRRASHKLGINTKGKGKKKRKTDDSDSEGSQSDFGPVKKKAKPLKKEGLLSYLRQEEPVKKLTAAQALKSSSAFGTTAPQKQGALLTHLVKKESPTQVGGASDDVSPEPEAEHAPRRGRAVTAKPTKKPTVIESDDDDDASDVFAAVAKEVVKKPAETVTTSRTARGATKQAPKYNIDNSESDSEGDDLLGDVSSMVKTIGASKGVPMFKSTTSARPGSAAGGLKAAKKATPIEIDGDTTNYEGLMPQPSPKRPAPRNVNDTIMSSDDDDFGLQPAASKLTAKSKPAAAKPAPKSKTTTSTLAAKKPPTLSPAAKAYAKQHSKATDALVKPAPKAKKPVAIDSDDDMEDADALANDILSDEEEDEDAEEPTPKPASRAPAARPGRRAAAKPAKYVVSDDEAESDEASEASFDEDSD
jgi:DNA topoisomerase-2